MDGRAQQPEHFATAFEAAFARLQVVLELACAEAAPWPRRAAAATRGALELAAAEPETAALLTVAPLEHGRDGAERYERLMSYLAGLLEAGRAESPYGSELPPTIERSLAGGVATIVANRVGRGKRENLVALAPEVVQFLLTPYVGTEEAKRLGEAGEGDWPRSQPGR